MNDIIPPEQFARELLDNVKKIAREEGVDEDELLKLVASMFNEGPMPMGDATLVEDDE